MNTYEKLLQHAQDQNINVYESFDLNGDADSPQKDRIDGLYIDGYIALDSSLDSNTKRSCVLAEEIGHHLTSHGNLLDQEKVSSRKQESKARLWAYNNKIGMIGIIRAYEKGCRNIFEMADFLDVTEKFMEDALKAYRSKYGNGVDFDNYTIYFEPSLGIMKRF